MLGFDHSASKPKTSSGESRIITGHVGDFHPQLCPKSQNFPKQKELTKQDYVIICGDFGGIWENNPESRQEKNDMDWLEKKSYTTLFVDGNHENFDRLYSYPEEEWHGGRVHKIRPSVLHLMRGQVFSIDGVSFFTFGGAKSHDISGGVLDPEDPNFRQKKKRLERNWEPYRVKHLSWWEQELASEAEMEEARKNLERVGWKVDYMISHCASTSIQQRLKKGESYVADSQTDFLEDICKKTDYKRWYFGHYHEDRNVTEKDILLYRIILPAGECVP